MKPRYSTVVIPLLIFALTSHTFAQANQSPTKETSARGYYFSQMQQLQQAIQDNFYDEDSGYYLIVVDPDQREVKNGYLREYTYFWALCAMFHAANEIEILQPDANLIDPLLVKMEAYLDTSPPKPGYSDYIMKLKPGERYYDDNQWVGITALEAYERTEKEKYLTLGKKMYDFMMTGYDDVLGGGLYWKETSKSSKNTCSNGPGVLVAIHMYKATKDKSYLETAQKIFNWTNDKLKTPDGLYYDNIRTKDERIGRAVFSYNTGTMLQSYIYLYECTGEKSYLETANKIADASLDYFYGRERFRDGYWFNAVLLRAYQHLLKHNNDLKYIRGFKKCLDNTLQNDKNLKGLLANRRGVRNLVEHGGMLEILARFAQMEKQYDLSETTAPADK